MTSRYALNAHLHCLEARPEGALPATIKTPHVMTTHPTRRARLHRPTYAVTANVDGRTVLAARFLCGSASASVTALDDHPDREKCAKCEQLAAAAGAFYVYAFFDNQGRALYVGQTNDFAARFRAHSVDRRSARWFSDVAWWGVLSEHTTRDEALAAEARAIAERDPVFNVRRPRFQAA